MFLKKAVKVMIWIFMLNLMFILLLTLTTGLIKRDMIKDNLEKTALYFEQKPLFEYKIGNHEFSLIHNYADVMLMNIIGSADTQDPFFAAIDAGIYVNKEDTGKENRDLCSVVFDGEKPNFSYSRYWHGTMLFVRPLLMITDITGIRLINIAAMLAVTAAAVILMLRKRLYAAAFSYIAANIMCSVVFVPLCIEYCSVFFIMNIACIVLLCKKKMNMLLFFSAIGALTCFFDFLTAEIITLFVPLALYLIINQNSDIKQNFKDTAVYSVVWFTGYACTWIYKWILAFLSCGMPALKLAVSQAAYRVTGYSEHFEKPSLIGEITGALQKTVGNVIPFAFTKNAFFVLLAALFVMFCIWYLYRKEISKLGVQLTLFAVALMPFIRYIAIPNHSYTHSFFTFRALFITVFCIIYAFVSSMDMERIRRKLFRCRR